MSNAEDFMLEARQTVAARRNARTHKITTMAWYTGRKLIQGAPAKALTGLGAVIPFPGVGGALNLAVDKAIEKFKATRKKKNAWRTNWPWRAGRAISNRFASTPRRMRKIRKRSWIR